MNTSCMPTSLEFRIISGKLGLTGKNIVFQNEKFFDLEVGEMVIQIGNGKENGTIRTDLFINPAKYVGSIDCQFSEKEKMYAFHIVNTESSEDFYVLYGKTPDEIFTEAVFAMKDRITGKTTGYMRFYKPVFVIVDKNFKTELDSNYLTELTIRL